jgi:hypothetical protein
MWGLILGVVAGAIAGAYWRDDLMRMRDKAGGDYASSARQRAAETLDSLEATVSSGLDRTRSTLRSWSQTIRSGEEGARPTSAEQPRTGAM